MPITTTYPGVYIQELPAGARSIAGVGTSVTAFVGVAADGPVNEPVSVFSFTEFERVFGGLWYPSGMSYAVQHYFLNGGSEAVIVRMLPDDRTKGTIEILTDADEPIVFEAAYEGSWFERVYVTIEPEGGDPTYFSLIVRQYAETLDVNPDADIVLEEFYGPYSLHDGEYVYLRDFLALHSALIRIPDDPAITGSMVAAENVQGTPGSDGTLGLVTVVGSGYESAEKGMYALEKISSFNILCLPPVTRASDGLTWADMPDSVWEEAAAYAAKRRAILLVDPPAAWTTDNAITDLADLGTPHANSAIYFPRIRMADPLRGNVTGTFAPSGAVAGVIARTDADRGFWKAPAGVDARLVGVAGLAVNLTEQENGQLNPLGVNVLRVSPSAGNVIWGARTRAGADRLSSEWKYLPVRRTALYIEQSLQRGLQWAVFEPNGSPLWAQIRLTVGAFMQELFRQGAFQGARPSEAYFVRCDAETNPQADIDRGVVNVVIGFAPLKPAEFVIVKLQQIVGQSAV